MRINYWFCYELILIFITFKKSELHITETESERICNIYLNSECSYNQICFYGLCECKPNYRQNQYNKCVSYVCKTDKECQSYDRRRICRSGECVCNDFLREDQISDKCENFCDAQSRCNTSQVCVDYSCECAPNYVWDKSGYNCIFKKCWSDRECWYSGDYNRECKDGECICQMYYKEDSQSKRCIYVYNKLVYLCLLFTIPIVLFFCAFLYFHKKRQRCRALQTSPSIQFTNTVNNELPLQLPRYAPPPPPYTP